MEKHPDLERVTAFHGHTCPGLAYGYRVARAALEALGPRARDEELVAVVENDSCAVDAIQVLIGCTFGKGNLVFRDHGKQVYTFYNRETGRGVRISVDYSPEESTEDREAWRRFLDGDTDPALAQRIRELKAAKVRAILEAPAHELLEIREAGDEPPPRARIHASIRCDGCGEKVMETRVRERGGRRLCIPCAGA